MNTNSTLALTTEKTTMHKILVSLFAIFLFALALTGCAGSEQSNSTETQQTGTTQTSTVPQTQQEEPKVTYKLPEGWKIVNNHSVYYETGPNGKKLALADLEFAGVTDGNDEDAKKIVYQPYQDELDACAKYPTLCNVAEIDTKYETQQLSTGTVYFTYAHGLASPDTYKDPELTYGNHFAFAKNGKVYNFGLYGKTLDHYTEVIEMLMKTIKIESN